MANKYLPASIDSFLNDHWRRFQKLAKYWFIVRFSRCRCWLDAGGSDLELDCSMPGCFSRNFASALRVALFIPSFGDGGVERGVVHTARGLADLGVAVDFLTEHRGRPYLDEIPASVNLIELHGDPRARFEAYLRSESPDVVISAKEQTHSIALAACRQAGGATKLVMRLSTMVSKRQRLTRFWRRWSDYRDMRTTLVHADLLIAVSASVARDTADILLPPHPAIRSIPSPVITPELFELAAAPVTHRWLVQRTRPVILAGGGLRRQKGFDDLLRAFARARAHRPLRLIIIGQGRLRRRLERLALRLGVAADVDLTGFVANPYPLLAHADLFVLSSRWEGAPTIVTESVALGRKVVATECGGGPGEILAGNAYATLVPVGEPRRMANAIETALDWPEPPVAALRATVRDYTLDVSATRYRDVLMALAGSA